MVSALRASMISGTDSPCLPSCSGIAMVKILTVDCLSFRPISVMSIFTVRIGICPHVHSFWLLPGISWKGTGRSHHDFLRQSLHIADALLYATAGTATACEPAHD